MKKQVPLHLAANWLNKFVEPTAKEIQIIGLGGAGCNIATYLYKKGFKATYSCLSNAERTDLPPKFLFIEHHLFSKEKRNLLNFMQIKWDEEGTKPDLDTTIPNPIEKILNKNARFILLVGLGHLTGSYLVKQFTDFLKDNKKEFAVVCTTPFSFEHETTHELSNRIKEELEKLTNFYCFSNENIQEKYGNMGMSKAFEKGNEEVWNICQNVLKP